MSEQRYNRYEKARILGARALQVSYGAPVLIDTDQTEPILVAAEEYDAGRSLHRPEGVQLMTRITGISLRRVLDSRGKPHRRGRRARVRRLRPRGSAQRGLDRRVRSDRTPGQRIHREGPRARGSTPEGVYAGDQRAVDNALRAADGTDDFSAIGANSAVAIRWRPRRPPPTCSVRRCTSTSGARSAVRIFRFRSATSSAAESTPRRRLTSRSSSRHPSAHRASRRPSSRTPRSTRQSRTCSTSAACRLRRATRARGRP